MNFLFAIKFIPLKQFFCLTGIPEMFDQLVVKCLLVCNVCECLPRKIAVEQVRRVFDNN